MKAYRQRVHAGTHRAIVEPDFAGVRRIDAGQDLDQRRLAGAVLAEQRMDLAAAQIEIDRVERERSGEMLGQAGDLEQRAGRRGAAAERLGLGHPSCASFMRSDSMRRSGAGRREAPAGLRTRYFATPQISR